MARSCAAASSRGEGGVGWERGRGRGERGERRRAMSSTATHLHSHNGVDKKRHDDKQADVGQRLPDENSKNVSNRVSI